MAVTGGKLQAAGEVELRGEALDLRARRRVSAYIQQVWSYACLLCVTHINIV